MYLNDIDENIVSEITETRKSVYNQSYKYIKKKVSNDTVNHTLSILSAVLYFAMDELEWIKQAPEIPLLPKEKRDSWLTPSEAQRLLEELPEDLNAKVRFSLATGLRQSNVLNLQWEHVDLKNKIAIVHFYDSKNEHSFNVPLNDWAMQVLQEQRGKHPTHVFSYNGKPFKKIQYTLWRKALDRAGICPFYSSSCNRYNDYPTKPLNEYKFPDGFRWHDLRHTWASWHIQSGTPLEILQKLGNWSSYDLVLRYAHHDISMAAAYANNISLD